MGNVAGDSPKCRDLVLGHGALGPLLAQLNEHAKLSMLRNATWTLSNFCRGKPQPVFEQVCLLRLGYLSVFAYNAHVESLYSCLPRSHMNYPHCDILQYMIHSRLVFASFLYDVILPL